MHYFLFFFIILMSSKLHSQTILSNNGALIQVNSNALLSLNGDLLNQSTGLWDMAPQSTLYIKGTIVNNSTQQLTTGTGGNIILTGRQSSIGGNTPSRFYHLEIALNNDSLQLDTSIYIDGNLQMSSGYVDLNGQNIYLSAQSTLVNERNSSHIFGTSGTLKITRNLNAPTNLNIGGLGLQISSSANLGSTTIERGHQAQTHAGSLSISRYYNVMPSTASSSNMSIQFHYFDTEIIGHQEANLQLWQSTNQGNSWAILSGGTVNSSSNYLSIGGLPSNVQVTLGSPISTLPIQSLAFKAELVAPKKVCLHWSTITEINSAYFEIERSADGLSYHSIGRVDGAGTSYERHIYKSWDLAPLQGNNYYRLKQVFFDGTSNLSPIQQIYIESSSPTIQLYPNPVFNNQSVSVFTQAQGTYQLTLYDALGRLVFEKQWHNSYSNRVQTIHLPPLSAANYFYHIQHQQQSTQGKLILLD